MMGSYQYKSGYSDSRNRSVILTSHCTVDSVMPRLFRMPHPFPNAAVPFPPNPAWNFRTPYRPVYASSARYGPGFIKPSNPLGLMRLPTPSHNTGGWHE